MRVTHPVLSGKRVAVIEDEPPIGLILGYMLDELGCVQAGSAKSLPEAMSLADDLDADVVLLDFRLKGQPSEPVARRLLERGVKVVITTGADDAELPENLRRCALVRKPFGLETIEQGLVAALTSGVH
jgi:DNA-binding response OmpR family regulator